MPHNAIYSKHQTVVSTNFLYALQLKFLVFEVHRIKEYLDVVADVRFSVLATLF